MKSKTEKTEFCKKLNLEYVLVRSRKRKKLALTVNMDGICKVLSPWNYPKDRIESFLCLEYKWIMERKEAQKSKPRYQVTDEEKENLRKIAKQIIPAKIYHYCNLMGIDYPDRIAITSAKTKWGSCTSDRHINISLYLMLYPEEAIDYVVVHEIAHLAEMNHSVRFWRIVASVFPDYKIRQLLLR